MHDKHISIAVRTFEILDQIKFS